MNAAEQQQESGTCQVVLGVMITQGQVKWPSPAGRRQPRDQAIDRLPLVARREVGVTLDHAEGFSADELPEREEINRFQGQA